MHRIINNVFNSSKTCRAWLSGIARLCITDCCFYIGLCPISSVLLFLHRTLSNVQCLFQALKYIFSTFLQDESIYQFCITLALYLQYTLTGANILIHGLCPGILFDKSWAFLLVQISLIIKGQIWKKKRQRYVAKIMMHCIVKWLAWKKSLDLVSVRIIAIFSGLHNTKHRTKISEKALQSFKWTHRHYRTLLTSLFWHKYSHNFFFNWIYSHKKTSFHQNTQISIECSTISQKDCFIQVKASAQ